VRHRSFMAAGVAVAVAALSLTACKSSSSSSSTSGGATNAGGGASGKTVVISTDLPLQGASKDTSDSTNKMIQLYLDQVGDKAGNYKIQLKTYDDSTAAAGQWDAATCSKNANDHVANKDEVAVMGTYNSGCAKIEVPILNAAPMLMVSHANTNPGLTKAWDSGEPAKYYPSGKRNYARVITTDDFQGAAAAAYAFNDLKVTRCYVVNDNQTYGQGVAKAFADAASKLGIKVLGDEAWDAKQPNYQALFTKIKATNPDCLYIGGIYDNNGGQLVKDKFNILGDNTKVKMIGPDGFTGYPALDKQPESQGMYVTFAGLSIDQLVAKAGAGAKLVQAYKTKYGADPVGSYPLYGVAATQVILAAIAKSDGTRQGVLDQVFSGSGITIDAGTSVIGKQFTINTQTGDVDARDISVLQEKGNKQVFVKAQPVT
jgi:branched-chain amino acid transport system substrate-binding protein